MTQQDQTEWTGRPDREYAVEDVVVDQVAAETAEARARRLLLGRRAIATRTVPIPGLDGVAVEVRQLSRAEHLAAAKRPAGEDVDPLLFERKVLTAAIVSPQMGEHEIAAWQKQPGAAAELQAVMDEVMTWSGFRQDAAKSGV